MHLLALWIALTFFATHTRDDEPPEPDPNFHIYLCFGQSNMEGTGEITEADKTAPDRLTMLATCDQPEQQRELGQWYPATTPLAMDGAGTGPADFFGRAMVEAAPENVRIGLVSVAIAGTKIELFQSGTPMMQNYLREAPPWVKERAILYGNDPYARLVEMAKLAQQRGVIKGILLHQGESNTGDDAWAEKVADVYKRLCADLELDPKDVPLLAGEAVSETEGGVCAAFNVDQLPMLPKLVPTAHLISSAGCEAQEDRVHFSRAGYETLGRRYAEQMLELQRPHAVR